MAAAPHERAETESWVGLRRRLERLGPLSPFVTLDPFAPGARRLLEHAERDAERVLHVVRLLVFVGGTIMGFLGFGLAQMVFDLWMFTIPVVAALAALWIMVWRRLGRGHVGFGLRA